MALDVRGDSHGGPTQGEKARAALLLAATLISCTCLALLPLWQVPVGALFWLWAIRNWLAKAGTGKVGFDGGVVAFLLVLAAGVWLAVLDGCPNTAHYVFSMVTTLLIAVLYGLVPFAYVRFFHGNMQAMGKAAYGSSEFFGWAMLCYSCAMVVFWCIAAPIVLTIRVNNAICPRRGAASPW